MGGVGGFQHDVGEGAADIDGQTGRRHASALMLPLATTWAVTDSMLRKTTPLASRTKLDRAAMAIQHLTY
jgi:hypothetical protein